MILFSTSIRIHIVIVTVIMHGLQIYMFALQMSLYKGKKIDPNKPKRPMTAYFIFLSDFRVKMKNRGVDHKEILRLGEPSIYYYSSFTLFFGLIYAGVRCRQLRIRVC